MQQVQELITEMRARGYRITPQRQLIVETVYRSRGHLTAEEILKAVHKRFPGVNISTVYRNLEVLEDLGLICHAHLGHTPGVWHPAEQRDHQHLVCRKCGGIEEIGVRLLEPVARGVRKANGFEVDLTHFALFGTCRHCQDG